MKRFSIISVLAALPLSLFAYYGDSYSQELPDFVKFLIFILFVWGILEVVLFFKIWGMTNNVKNIKDNILHSNTTELLRKYRLLGQNDKAAEVLIQAFLNDMEKTIHSDSYFSGQKIEGDVAELEFSLSQLGATLPEEFKKLKIADDYYKLGSMKTLKRAEYEKEQAAKSKEQEQSSEK